MKQKDLSLLFHEKEGERKNVKYYSSKSKK